MNKTMPCSFATSVGKVETGGRHMFDILMALSIVTMTQETGNSHRTLNKEA